MGGVSDGDKLKTDLSLSPHNTNRVRGGWLISQLQRQLGGGSSQRVSAPSSSTEEDWGGGEGGWGGLAGRQQADGATACFSPLLDSACVDGGGGLGGFIMCWFTSKHSGGPSGRS